MSSPVGMVRRDSEKNPGILGIIFSVLDLGIPPNQARKMDQCQPFHQVMRSGKRKLVNQLCVFQLCLKCEELGTFHSFSLDIYLKSFHFSFQLFSFILTLCYIIILSSIFTPTDSKDFCISSSVKLGKKKMSQKKNNLNKNYLFFYVLTSNWQ